MERTELQTMPVVGSQWTQVLEASIQRHPDSVPTVSPEFAYTLTAAIAIALLGAWTRGFGRRSPALRLHKAKRPGNPFGITKPF